MNKWVIIAIVVAVLLVAGYYAISSVDDSSGDDSADGASGDVEADAGTGGLMTGGAIRVSGEG